ncbi:MAG: hypothetical protein P8186_28500, partial [Anaerolineae bacterium]
QRARRLARQQDRLTARLYRFNCPSSMELGEYHLGLLPDDQATAVARHLAECPHCAREVVQLKDYLAELAPDLEFSPAEQLKGRVRLLVARLVTGGLEGALPGQPSLAPAYAALRGEEGEPLIYEADGIQVVVEVHQDPHQLDDWTILGLVIGVDNPNALEVHLWRADQRVATVPVEDTGNFSFSNLTAGRYELILGGPEVEIHIQDLEVGTS